MKEETVPATRGASKLKEAAKYLGGVSQITVRRLIERGLVRDHKPDVIGQRRSSADGSSGQNEPLPDTKM